MRGRILLIEDNELNRYLVTFLLGKYGFEVLAAEDGPTGIALAEQESPDLVLLDIQLPRMDGYEVARALRRSPALAQTSIVAVTSYATSGDRRKALEAGFDGYLEKPINPDRFVDQVQGFLDARGTTG